MSKANAPRNQLLIAGIALAVLALLFGVWFYHNTQANKSQGPANLRCATVLDTPRPLAPFHLTDSENHFFTNANLKGHWSMIFFGFTNCPDLCPTTLTIVNNAYQKLAAEKQHPMPQVVFISVDPDRDTTQKIKDYLAGFNPHFVGATGKKPAIDALTQQLDVLYMKVKEQNSGKKETYTIDHSGTIIVTNPEGQFYGIFSLPHQADAIAHDIKAIINQPQPKV